MSPIWYVSLISSLKLEKGGKLRCVAPNYDRWPEQSKQENGILAEFQLAPEGVRQAQLAGELFRKVSFASQDFMFVVTLYSTLENAYSVLDFLFNLKKLYFRFQAPKSVAN